MKISLYVHLFFKKLLYVFIISMGMILILSGCTVTTGIYEENAKAIRPANLNIVRGQPLEIYFEKLSQFNEKESDIKAWESTKLFSSVTQTQLDQPSTEGYFLRVACERYHWGDGLDLVTGILWWLTAFTIPIPESEDHSCELTMYENSIQIASDTTSLRYESWSNGWALLPYYFKSESIYAGHAQTTANIRVRKVMSALTKGDK